MAINPLILLIVGSIFAILYATVIIFGWARTRRNRKILQESEGITEVPVWFLEKKSNDTPTFIKTFSLSENIFLDNNGKPIQMSDYDPFIAIGESPEYPEISSGDLVLKEKSGKVKFIFTLPDISEYR